MDVSEPMRRALLEIDSAGKKLGATYVPGLYLPTSRQSTIQALERRGLVYVSGTWEYKEGHCIRVVLTEKGRQLLAP